tara:strand:+ start:143 stop:841 length:699 start_codon:yes stop_codon:yes gene_type:complete
LKKIICIFILASQISWAQEIRVIDNKGTINTARNNQVTTSDTEPANPLENDVWFDNTDATNVITKIWDGNATWKSIEIESKTLILNRFLAPLPTNEDQFFPLPLRTTDIVNDNDTYYEVTNLPLAPPGAAPVGCQITILEAGNYLISGEISTNAMPAGDTKYILALFINGQRKGYLSRGFIRLQVQAFWGTTGIIMYRVEKDDIITIEYVINLGATDPTLNANFLNIGITKL